MSWTEIIVGFGMPGAALLLSRLVTPARARRAPYVKPSCPYCDESPPRLGSKLQCRDCGAQLDRSHQYVRPPVEVLR